MCDSDKSREWAANNLLHAITFTRAAWVCIQNVPELSNDRTKLSNISAELEKMRTKYLYKWHQSFHNDYEHIKGEYRLTCYLGSDCWTLTFCPFGGVQKDIAHTLTAGVSFEEARLWADSEIVKYEAKGN